MWRTTTLTLSNAPVSASIANDSQNDLLSPNTIVATPKPATAQSIARPAFFIGGRWAMSMAAAKAPMAGAARSHPNATSSTFSTSRRKTGSR